MRHQRARRDLSLCGGQVEDVICLADLFLHAFVFDRARRSSREQSRRPKQLAQVIVEGQSLKRHRRMTWHIAIRVRRWKSEGGVVRDWGEEGGVPWGRGEEKSV